MGLLLPVVIGFLLILVLWIYVKPFLKRYSQLREDYREISLLPISAIPFVGNLHLIDKRQWLFFQLLCQMSKICQEQDKGVFCLWYALWPMTFLCTGKGLEAFINNSKQLVKSFDYTFLEPWLKTGLLTGNHEKWRNRRRLITPSFHDTQLLHNFVNIFNEQASILARRFGELAKQLNKTHDLYPYISACTLDIIAETATGTHPKAQLSEGRNEFVEATVRLTDLLNLRMRSPWLWPDFIFYRLPVGREHDGLLKILHGFSRKIIEERLATFHAEETTDNEDKRSTRRLVFLDSLLTQMHNEKLTLADIQEEVDTFMFEGHDTTAAAITFFCYLMGCYPDVQAKVHAELDSIFEDDRERACTMEDVQQMTYLDCVIKESMRMLAPVPYVIREAQEDFLYRDQMVRKGTSVFIFIHGIHHDASIFPEPEKFDPERFVDNSLISNERSPFAFIPFSAGSRNCIGQRFAGLEEKVVLATLFRGFSFRSTQTIDQLQLFAGAILRTNIPIQMHVEER